MGVYPVLAEEEVAAVYARVGEEARAVPDLVAFEDGGAIGCGDEGGAPCGDPVWEWLDGRHFRTFGRENDLGAVPAPVPGPVRELTDRGGKVGTGTGTRPSRGAG